MHGGRLIDTSSLMAMNSDSFIIFACEKAELVVHTANKGASNIPLNRVRRALFLQEPEQRIPARAAFGFKIPNFKFFFRHLHGDLNLDEIKNVLRLLSVNGETNLMNLIRLQLDAKLLQ